MLLPAAVFAQQADTLSAMRRYVQVSTAYKHLPMHASVELRNSSNLPSRPEDTATTEAEFYLAGNGAYIKFGEMEELAGDSLMVMVSGIAHRMMVVTSKVPITNLQDYIGIKPEDSSLQKMAAKYTAAVLPEKGGTTTIKVESRADIYGTTEPKETILFRYKEKTGIPVDLIQTKRILLQLDSAQYSHFLQVPGFKDKFLLQLKNNFYLIKERTCTFRYKKIEYNDDVHIPATINNRIIKNTKGEYVPAKGYEGFIVSSQK